MDAIEELSFFLDFNATQPTDLRSGDSVVVQSPQGARTGVRMFLCSFSRDERTLYVKPTKDKVILGSSRDPKDISAATKSLRDYLTSKGLSMHPSSANAFAAWYYIK